MEPPQHSPPPSHPINPPIKDGGVRWIDGGAIDGGMGEEEAAHSIHGWNGSEEWDGYAYGLDGNGGWIRWMARPVPIPTNPPSFPPIFDGGVRWGGAMGTAHHSPHL